MSGRFNWRQNALTRRLGVDLPIFLAPMGQLCTPELAATVTNSGGVGGMGMFGADTHKLRDHILAFRQQSTGALNINFVLFDHDPDGAAKSAPMKHALASVYQEHGLEFPTERPDFANKVEQHHLDALIETRPEVISFHFGLPADPVLDALRNVGALIISSATTVVEARELERRGADAVIAQGLEAGGHRGTFTKIDTAHQSTLVALVPQIVDAVSIPVIAAGGIADGRGIAAALMLGASAVQLGTAFLPCPESGIPDQYRHALGQAKEGGTEITLKASGKPARILSNAFAEKMSMIEAPAAPFPEQFGLARPLAEVDESWLAVYAGQSAPLSRAIPAKDLMTLLEAETDAAFSRFL